MTFVGLDLHKRYITACAMDAGGTVLAEVRQMAVSLEALAGFLSALPAPITVGLEACLSAVAARPARGAGPHGARRRRAPGEGHLASALQD